jgi:5'-3' exoribonuclease 2
MGVPALFRWLSTKYPKIISRVIEELPVEVDNGDGTQSTIPTDATKPNPNGEEMDNLYLDMNGIVHPCSHPEDRPAPANEEEMMIAVFEYTERVVNMVRPRKLLMIAVDGVAPRAKMNQQRSRRFRSAQEAAEKDKAVAEYHEMMKAKGASVEGEGEEKPQKTWDSNAITPGTPFMDILAASLRYWVQYKLNTDPAWAKLKIIISDATVPGEGEHKIMNFVRSQRSSPTHDPNTRHVMYGLDADLIMLGLATHEPHFRILREDVFANDTKPGHCRKCGQPGHMADSCRGTAPKPDETAKKPLKPFIWLHVSVLREYLAIELSVPNQGFTFDLERALDDWVFMCFFVGNDFLPHLPSLDIRENAIDTLIAIWRDNLPEMGGYVTKDGHVDLPRAQYILDGLAKQEDAIFKRRRQTEVQRDEAQKRRAVAKERRDASKRQRFNGGDNGPSGYDEPTIVRGPRGGIQRGEPAPDINALPTFAPGQAQTMNDPRYANRMTHADVVGQANADNKSAAAAMKERLANSKKPADNQKAELEALFAQSGASDGSQVLGKRARDMVEEAKEELSTAPTTPGRNTPDKEIADPMNKGTSGALGGNSADVDFVPEDTVKLWEDGYEARYYEQKFHVAPDDIDFRRKVANAYVEGLCWVLLYYFQGCPSWTWYYPYHYAPFGADFKDIGNLQIEFSKGKPFRPYEQLMGVMPARSNHTIPKVFHPLMTDEDSPIIEFYPEDFEIDLNGKKFAWQGVAVLPFIDEKRLLDAMGTKYPLLSDDEVRRNAFGHEALIFSTRHPFYEEVAQNFYSKKAGAPKFKIDSKLSEGLSGKVEKAESYDPNSSLEFPLPTTQEKFTRLENDESVTVNYYMPENRGVHKSMLLPGIVFNPSALDYDDVQATRNRANKSGRSHGGVALTQNGGRSDGQRMNYGARDNGPPHNQNGGGYNAQNHGYGQKGGYGGPPPQRDNFSALPPGLAAQAAAHGVQQGLPPGFQQGPPRGGGYYGGSYEQRGGRGGGGRGGGGGGYGGYQDQRGGYNQGYGRGGYGQGGNGYGGNSYGGGGYSGGGYGGNNGRGGQGGGRRY